MTGLSFMVRMGRSRVNFSYIIIEVNSISLIYFIKFIFHESISLTIAKVNGSIYRMQFLNHGCMYEWETSYPNLPCVL